MECAIESGQRTGPEYMRAASISTLITFSCCPCTGSNGGRVSTRNEACSSARPGLELLHGYPEIAEFLVDARLAEVDEVL